MLAFSGDSLPSSRWLSKSLEGLEEDEVVARTVESEKRLMTFYDLTSKFRQQEVPMIQVLSKMPEPLRDWRIKEPDDLFNHFEAMFGAQSLFIQHAPAASYYHQDGLVMFFRDRGSRLFTQLLDVNLEPSVIERFFKSQGIDLAKMTFAQFIEQFGEKLFSRMSRIHRNER
jgi:hypothetical protein